MSTRKSPEKHASTKTNRPDRFGPLLMFIACLAILALAQHPSTASDWMPQIEEEKPSHAAPQQPLEQSQETDPLTPVVEQPNYALQKAPVRSGGKGIGVPVLVTYSALNKDLRTLTKNKPVSFKSKCDVLSLHGPKLSLGGEAGLVSLKCPMNVLVGGKQGGACQTIETWNGMMAAMFKVGFDFSKLKLSFKPQALELKGQEGGGAPPEIVKVVQNFLDIISKALLGKLSLQKHVSSPGSMATGLFQDAGDWLNDLDQPAGWKIRKVSAVRAGLEVSLETQGGAQASAQAADQAVSDQELLGLWSGWESWDNYLVGVCKSMGKAKLNRGQQDKLLTALLDNRYAMAANRGQKKLAPSKVRSQIESSWQEVKPVVAQVTARSGEAKAGSLTKIMAAGDAMTGALERNPALAAKIKPSGINQLFGPEAAAPAASAKRKPADSDNYLRDALGLGPDPTEEEWKFSDEPPDVEEWPLPSIPKKPPPKTAKPKKPKPKKPPKPGAPPPPPGAPVKRSEWVPDFRNPKAYVTKVRGLMAQTADQVLKKGGPAAKYRDMFLDIVAATAWQESCWIHYVRKKDGRIAILGSYDKKSAGIMQINFQVWKGIYNTDLLRKSIRYNARAGCEILKLYMERYALRKMDKKNPPPPDLLARSIYSMYNGGPRQFKGFFRRLKNHKLWQSEKLWNQKFERVKSGQWNKIKGCMPATARWAK